MKKEPMEYCEPLLFAPTIIMGKVKSKVVRLLLCPFFFICFALWILVCAPLFVVAVWAQAVYAVVWELGS